MNDLDKNALWTFLQNQECVLKQYQRLFEFET